jgi:hypothetical protein
MPDLFISYSSQDRPWAERLFNDLRRDYPTLDIFWDRQSIAPGSNWAGVLQDCNRKSAHFLLLWSEFAKQSNEVGPEVAAFRQSVNNAGAAAGSQRKLFYVPLQGAYGPLEQSQGFPDFKAVYSSTAADRGVGSLADSPHKNNWQRLLRMVGDTVLDSESTQPVQLAIVAMDSSNFRLAADLQDTRLGPGPTLREFLGAYGITLQQAEMRYGANAFAWKPFGTGETIIELMETLRVATNKDLSETYQSVDYNFHWVPSDFVGSAMATADESGLQAALNRLESGPSVVVIDAISLYNPAVSNILRRLNSYAAQQRSVIVGIAPMSAPVIKQLYQAFRSNASPVLDPFFRPRIPAAGSFALCCLNVCDVADIQRLILGSLGTHQLRSRGLTDQVLLLQGASA